MAADPLRAATAYRDMASAVYEAQDAAYEATAAVKDVARQVGLASVVLTFRLRLQGSRSCRDLSISPCQWPIPP